MRRLFCAAFLTILLAGGSQAFLLSEAYAAATPSQVGQKLDPVGQKLDPPPVRQKHQKIDSSLLDIIDAATRGAAALNAAARSQGIGQSGQKVRVTVYLSPASGATGRAKVVSAGGDVIGEYRGVLDVFLPTASIERLATDPSVQYLAHVTPPSFEAVADEAVAASNALAWHAAGWTGVGVKVAVIDGGFIGYTNAQASGDLPAGLITQDFGCGGIATITNH